MAKFATTFTAGDGATTSFVVNFKFISREDVDVSVLDAGDKDTADGTKLTAIETGTPGASEYKWESDTQITVGQAPSSSQRLKIQRTTDMTQQVVSWRDGSYIISEDLNTSEEQSLYTDQELADWIGNLTGGGTGPDDLIKLNDLGDVTIDPLPLQGEILSYDLVKEQWTNGKIQVENIDPDFTITEAEQNAGVTPTDDRVFTSKAAATRFDTLVQVATPPRTDYEIGKSWLQNDRFFTFSVWDGTGWTPVASGGSFLSQPTVIYVDAANGDDSFDGHRIINPMRTIKAAVEQANTEVQKLTTNVIAATYDNETGIATFTTDTPHGVYIGTQLTFTDQVWRCDDGTEIFPRANDTWFVSERLSDTQFRVQMSTSSKAHTYDLRETQKIGGGTVTGASGFLGDGWIIYVAPGVYKEEASIPVRARNLSIVGASIRSTFIHPTKETETNSMFLADSGFYLSNFTIAGLKASGVRGDGGVDPDPVYGLPSTQSWVVEFRKAGQPPGAPAPVIRKSPYIQNCTNFADASIDNDAFDPNLLPGEGGDLTSAPCGGGMLIDGSAVDPASPLRSFVVDSFTQIALNGPGCLATNNAYAQLVSFFGTFCWYHAKSLNGGQLNLSNCTTDFGQYGLIADGKSPAPIFSAAVTGNQAAGEKIIELSSFTRGTLWNEPRAMTPADHMVVEIGGTLYAITRAVSATEVEIFRPKSNDPNTPEAFENGGLLEAVNDGTTARFYLQSYISTGGHTFEYTGSGTDYRAHPDFGGVPENDRQVVELGGEGEGRLAYVNGGRVWQSSTDENGKFQVGSALVVDQKTGTIEPAFADSVTLNFKVKEPGLDLRGWKIYQGNEASSNASIQLEPRGTGSIIFGTPDLNSDGERVRPSPIMAPILENIPDGLKRINQADLNRSSPVLTQNDVGYDADEIPISGLLGELAFANTPGSVGVTNGDPLPNEIKFVADLDNDKVIMRVGAPNGDIYKAEITVTKES